MCKSALISVYLSLFAVKKEELLGPQMQADGRGLTQMFDRPFGFGGRLGMWGVAEGE
jgi:hypothetical protein